jgi:competence protein ComEA
VKNWQKLLQKIVSFLPLTALVILLIALGIRFYPAGKSDEGLEARSIVQEVLGEKTENTQECSIYIDVGGAVAKPGVYCLRSGERLITAVQKAGGYLKSAYASKYVSRYLNLALPVKEDQKLYIPYQTDLSCTIIPFELKAQQEKEVLDKINEGEHKEQLEKDDEEETGCVSINTASKTQLMTVSGVGESMSQKIIDGRPYKQLEDLKNVSGVGDATFEKFKPFICL